MTRRTINVFPENSTLAEYCEACGQHEHNGICIDLIAGGTEFRLCPTCAERLADGLRTELDSRRVPITEESL